MRRAVFLTAFLWALVAQADQPDESMLVRESIENLLECSAFYSTGVIGAERNPDIQTDMTTIEAARDLSLQWAFALAATVDMSSEALGAKLTLYGRDLSAQMNGSFVNFSVLQLRYGDWCLELLTILQDDTPAE